MNKHSHVRRRLGAACGAIGLLASGLAAAVSSSAAPAEPPDDNPANSKTAKHRVLVFTDDIESPESKAGTRAIRSIGKDRNFSVQATQDAGALRAESLTKFNAVVFLNSDESDLNEAEKAAFEDYFRAGGGFVGIGSAVETEPDWGFFTDLIGTRSTGRTPVQAGTVKVADRGHDASKNLPEYWTRTDAWYNFEKNVRGESHVLATVVEKLDDLGSGELQPWGGRLTGISGGTMGPDHPVTWCKDYLGGRSFYTSLGNTAASFAEAGIREHLAGAIDWAAGVSDPSFSDCGATILGNYQQSAVALPPNIGTQPIGFDVLPDGRVIQTDRQGALRLHDPDTDTTTVLANIPVYLNGEDGLYGPAIDNDFETNKWVYLYYAPPTVEDVKLSTGQVVTQTTPGGNAPNTGASPTVWDPFVGYNQVSRFKFVDATETEPAHLDLDSEEQILRVSTSRGSGSHVGGDIDFDDDNNLWLVTGDDSPGGAGEGFGAFDGQLTPTGLYKAPHIDSRRSAGNTNDLRGKLLRIDVKDGDISESEANEVGGAYDVPSGNLFPVGTEKTRPEIYAMGFRNPFRLQVDSEGVAYVTDYSPDAFTPETHRGPAGTGRVEIVRKPANYGWPLCVRADLPYYRWDFNNSRPLDTPPQPHECGNPDRGPINDSRWNLEGGPSVEPGLRVLPPVTNADVWYSFDTENRPNDPLGTPCFDYYNGSGATACPRLFPELGTGRVGPHGAAKYEYDADSDDETKFPAYYDGSVFFGEFARSFLREIRIDSHDRVFKINDLLDCGGLTPDRVPQTDAPFECDTPMDLQFDESGHFYLMTYGGGFSGSSNSDAGLYRWDYVKGQRRAPRAVLSADPTSGLAPLVVDFSSDGSIDPDAGDSIRFEWDFDGNGSVDSVERNPRFTYTTPGQYTARLTVFDSSGNSASANTPIVVGNTAPTVLLNAPVDGGVFSFGDAIPYSVNVTDPEDGAIDCSRVQVTFVLGHDAHGHDDITSSGCSGVLQTNAGDVSHGGVVWGIIRASYTDLGGSAGVPALTSDARVNVRQKRQEVEFSIEESGTSVAGTNDPQGGGQHRSSMDGSDWIGLNGPFNLRNVDAITFRVRSSVSSIPAGAPMGALEVRLDSPNGPLLTNATLTSPGGSTWGSQTFPIADPGGLHKVYLVVRTVPGGASNNPFNLNWSQFEGPGVSG